MKATWPASTERPPAGTRRRHPRCAFTLIELMIVIGIVAIIVATAVPPFARVMRKEGLRKAVADVVEGCSYARAQAILHGAPTELVIRAEDGQITVRPMPGRRSEFGAEPAVSAGGTGTSAGAIGFKGSLPDDIAVKWLLVNLVDQMEFPEARVHFFPNGTCDEFSMILSATTGEQLITLDVITGLADVKVVR